MFMKHLKAILKISLFSLIVFKISESFEIFAGTDFASLFLLLLKLSILNLSFYFKQLNYSKDTNFLFQSQILFIISIKLKT